MIAVPADVSTDAAPPLGVPLRHFVVATAVPLVGTPLALVSGAVLAHVHLLLAGWVCLTIMGAMTQFVPVWSGVPLHSQRLAGLQLTLALAGVAGLAAAFATGRLAWLPVAGAVLLAGLWTFVYGVGRTLAAARPFDVTEAHFAFALACFVAVPAFGVLLAVDLVHPVLGPVPRGRVVGAHATLAVFGAILATVAGALYQLATMFTGTTLSAADRVLQRVETAAYPPGVLALAVGRLLGHRPLARLGAVLVLSGLAALALVLAHRLATTTVDWTPMHSRYAVAAVALGAWVARTAPAWLADPFAATLGAPHLLTFGAVGFVVLGTLYHVVPFLVWVERYADRLGLEPVPLVDDLYDDRLARADLVALVAGGGFLLAGRPLVGGLLATAGFAGFAANVALVLHRHAPGSLSGVLLARGVPDR